MMAELQNTMPHGWDCLYDRISGRYYYINHYTKTTTWEDPRHHHRPRHAAAGHHTSSGAVEHIAMQDLSNISKNSPRGARVQDSSLTTATNTEEAVAKISAMFPTVSDTHIRLLLKKYMKSIFPKADETIILDILSNNDNNIQKASDALKEMGFERSESAKLPRHRRSSKWDPLQSIDPQPQVSVAPKITTLDDKKRIKSELQEKYKDIPEQVITIALESVDFDEDRAIQILQIMVQEEKSKAASEQQESIEEAVTEREPSVQSTSVVPLSQSRQSLKSILKTEKSDYSLKDSSSFSRVLEESGSMSDADYRSSNIINTYGANRGLVKGANQELLLEDYIKWQGPQPGMRQGPQSLAKGPNASLRSSRSYQACGPNAELRKGPKFGLAKGSLFSQLKGVVSGESRGK